MAASHRTTNGDQCQIAPHRIEHLTIKSTGEFIGGGVSGIIQRLPSGNIAKSPWPGSRESECRRDLTTEAAVYQRLGESAHLVKVISWHAVDCVLCLEYMPNGDLHRYLENNNATIQLSQRLRWAKQAAQALCLLHTANVMHCDVEPKNFLLDGDLNLRIIDFSGSSLDGSRATACPGTRFEPPNFDWKSPQTIQDDLFSLGSTIFNIITGHRPYNELSSDQVRKHYQDHEFPSTRSLPCGQVVEQCWRGEMTSAHEVIEYFDRLVQWDCPSNGCKAA